MAKPAPNLSVAKPKRDDSALRNALQEVATPATHDDGPTVEQETKPRQKTAAKIKTQLIGAHLSTDVGKQLRMIAAEKDTDVKALLIRAINMLFKEEGKPQIARDPLKD